VLAALLAAGVAWALVHGSRPLPPIEAGIAAPAFALPRLADGEELALSSLRGKVVLVNFWATWCRPCEAEMPAMERLYQSLKDREFELVAISVDEKREDVAAFRERLGLSFPILLDPGKDVAGEYQSQRFPESYLIGRDGVLVQRYIGPREWDAPEYRARIQRLLEGDAS